MDSSVWIEGIWIEVNTLPETGERNVRLTSWKSSSSLLKRWAVLMIFHPSATTKRHIYFHYMTRLVSHKPFNLTAVMVVVDRWQTGSMDMD